MVHKGANYYGQHDVKCTGKKVEVRTGDRTRAVQDDTDPKRRSDQLSHELALKHPGPNITRLCTVDVTLLFFGAKSLKISGFNQAH